MATVATPRSLFTSEARPPKRGEFSRPKRLWSEAGSPKASSWGRRAFAGPRLFSLVNLACFIRKELTRILLLQILRMWFPTA